MEVERNHGVKNWTATEKFIFRLACLLVPLFVLTLPYPHDLLPDPGHWLMPLTTKLARFAGDYLFRLDQPYVAEVLSDSTGMYLHTFNVILISLLGALVWTVADRRRPHYEVLRYWLFACIRYYLALALLEYGFAKVFKSQFFEPEPNTLFTPLGGITRDLAYWSVVGSSRSYNLFLGGVEVLAAILLLFRRTTLLGAILSLGIMANVLAVNMGFFISVKVYSSFLLLLSLILILPEARPAYRFFVHGRAERIPMWKPVFGTSARKWAFYSAKYMLVAFLLAESLWPNFLSGNWNDDAAPRPKWHGAYRVEAFHRDGELIEACEDQPQRWRMYFIHRRGYFITQDMAGNLQDYALRYAEEGNGFQLENTVTKQSSLMTLSQQPDSVVSLEGTLDGHRIVAVARQLPYRQMPLLHEEFRWTMDPE